MKQREQTFSHPGVFSTQEELDRVRAIVNGSEEHPMKQGWQKLLSWEGSSLDSRPDPAATVYVWGGTPPNEEVARQVYHDGRFRRDAHVAYSHALQWVLTGKQAHADKAMDMMAAWATTFETMIALNHGDRQRALKAGWVAAVWAAAAEIIRYRDAGAAGWPEQDIERFNAGLLDPLYEYCLFLTETTTEVPNQALICCVARMATGIFQNRPERYEAARDQFAELLRTSVHASGEHYEVCRDPTHAQYVISCLVYGAEVAWHQGDDLYGMVLDDQERPRLWYSLEYMARLDLGIPQDTRWRKQGPKNFEGEGDNFTGWEMALNHYENRMGIELPYSRRLVETRGRPYEGDNHFVRWDTLTHADLGHTKKDL